MVSGVYYGMWAQHMFQVKYVWSNTCGGAKREDVDRRSRSETLEQSGADRNNRNKNRKRCDIIAVPPTNGPCPHGLMARSSSPGWLFASSRRIGPFRSVRMSSIEIHFKVEVLVAFNQDLGPFVRIDIISILPCIVLFQKPIPPNLKLEPISEPSSIDVLLHDPEVLIVDLHGWWSQFPPMWDRIGNGFGKDVDVKHIVNFPLRGQGESICEVQELFGDLKWAVSLACQFRRWLVCREVCCL
jgi:hypothetical protein